MIILQAMIILYILFFLVTLNTYTAFQSKFILIEAVVFTGSAQLSMNTNTVITYERPTISNPSPIFTFNMDFFIIQMKLVT